jgi:poly-gamma-glutamate synthesis protein (capsule biosynthesis protein)
LLSAVTALLFFIAFLSRVDYYSPGTMKTILAIIASLCVSITIAAAADTSLHDEITIAAVGDLMLGGRTEPFLKEFGPAYPFTEVMPTLGKADVVVGNLESPISLRGKAVENKKFTLRAGPIAAHALRQAGIRVVTLANNHSMDFGPLALQDTLTALDEDGILFTGAGMNIDDARSPALLKIKDKTLAFLSYSLTFPLEFFASENRPGTAPGYSDFVKTDIEKIRPLADLVIVSFHWGAELMTAAKDYQVELGRQAIDWGADLVLGHHPHVLQELEIYKGRLIAYSLGNFVFGSESNRTNTSMILLLTFQDNKLVRAEAVPLDVNNYRVKYRPHVLSGPAAFEALDGVNKASARFRTQLSIENDRGILALTPVGKAKNVDGGRASFPTDSSNASAASNTATFRPRTESTVPAPGNSPQTSSSTGAP